MHTSDQLGADAKPAAAVAPMSQPPHANPHEDNARAHSAHISPVSNPSQLHSPPIPPPEVLRWQLPRPVQNERLPALSSTIPDLVAASNDTGVSTPNGIGLEGYVSGPRQRNGVGVGEGVAVLVGDAVELAVGVCV